jgi:hypothetical protein
MIGNDIVVPTSSIRSRSTLGATQLCESHPLSTNESSLRHEYPQPKAYKVNSQQFIENRPVFEEMTGSVKSLHHRYNNPLAFENRHKKVFDEDNDAFRRSKASTDITSATLDIFGNPTISNISKDDRIQQGITRRKTAALSHNEVKGWTRLSKTNIGFPNFSKDMSKNNVHLNNITKEMSMIS